jgi:hypothetical protein
MSQRFASCTCGQLQLRCQGAPNRVSMCHCADCQRRTGSVFGIAAFFDRGAVSVVQGASKTSTRDSASGKPVTFHFCPECGSTIFWEPQRVPHLVGVAVGAFADPSFPQPQQSVWTDNKHAWLCLPEDMHVFAATPPAHEQPDVSPDTQHA